MTPKIGSYVQYHYPGSKTPKGRDILDTLPALVLRVHDDSTIDVEALTPFGSRERRDHIRPLSSRDPAKHRTEADFYVDELTETERAAAAAAKKIARKAELEAELAKL